MKTKSLLGFCLQPYRMSLLRTKGKKVLCHSQL